MNFKLQIATSPNAIGRIIMSTVKKAALCLESKKHNGILGTPEQLVHNSMYAMKVNLMKGI
jgi:hypothetical protein